jgi:hypothetical protein
LFKRSANGIIRSKASAVSTFSESAIAAKTSALPERPTDAVRIDVWQRLNPRPIGHSADSPYGRRMHCDRFANDEQIVQVVRFRITARPSKIVRSSMINNAVLR